MKENVKIWYWRQGQETQVGREVYSGQEPEAVWGHGSKLWLRKMEKTALIPNDYQTVLMYLVAGVAQGQDDWGQQQ